MKDLFLSIATKIAEYTVHPILHHAQYLCCFNNFASNLPYAKENLEFTRDGVKERISEAMNRVEKVEPTVEKWLKDVEKVLEEVQMLEERILSVNKGYFRRQCQYSLAKQIERKTTEMIQLHRNSKFEPFSRIIELPGMKYYSSKDFFMFNSTEVSYKKLLETLKNKSAFIIGLVGLGGSGKTTLAKEVGKKAEDMKIFEKVVWATVSQPLNIRTIQAQIVDQLGFNLIEESEIGRAQRLSERLRKGTTLVILDDVWKKLNFEALGIPLDESSKACCVLITTRSKDVCTSMQCQSIIELNLLNDEEAWTLFRHYANITDDSSEALKGVARKIVNECKGLPIAIVTVGSTLKDTTIANFELALSRLEISEPLDIPQGFRSPYVCLELSYNNLTNPLAQSLLLLCSMFPEDSEIDLEDLFRFGRGFGTIWKMFGTLEKARREMDAAIDMLKNCFLLMPAKEKYKVKMHDLVRDVALWIASKSGQAIFTRTEVDPRALADDETLKDMKAIVIWGLTSYDVVNYKINCPILEILVLSFNVGGEVKVSNECLQSLEKLKTLSILNLDEWDRGILALPESLKSLKNIQTLCLRGYDLGDISVVERLQALEILDLRGSSFDDLPVGIVGLKKLKLLDLYKCVIKKNTIVEAYKVVGKCLQIEELYLYLSNYVMDFPHEVSYSKLQRYPIINTDYYYHGCDFEDNTIMKKYAKSRSLLIERFDITAQNLISLPIKDLFIRAEYLCLRNLRGDYKNIIPSMDQQGMNQLIALVLEHCSKIERLIDSTIYTNRQTEGVFSALVYLSLKGLHNLQEMFCDPCYRCSLENLQELLIEDCSKLNNMSFPKSSSLCNLKILSISKCLVLTYLFMPSIVQTLMLLEVLKISSCSALRHIIEEVEEGNDVHSSTKRLQKLRILEIEDCHNLEYIFTVILAQELVSLESVKIVSNMKLKYVFGSEKEHNPAVYQSFHQQSNISIHFPNLNTLNLTFLPNVIRIWPEYCHLRLPSLEESLIILCPKLSNSSIDMAETASNLEQHTISMDCSEFMDSKLCNLTVLRISECPMLTSLFMSTIVQALEFLEVLRLSHCSALTHITDKGNHSSLTLSKLRILDIEECDNLKYVFSLSLTLKSLKSVKIVSNSKLKYVFGSEKEHNLMYPSFQIVTFHRLQNLLDFNLSKLTNLINIWPEHCRPHLPNLKKLHCTYCPQLSDLSKVMSVSDLGQLTTSMKTEILCLITNTFQPQLKAFLKCRELCLRGVRMKGIFQFQMGEERGTTELDLLNLDINYLRLENLPELNFIWKGPTGFLSLQNLYDIRVDGCPKLKTIFSTTIVASLPVLRILNISNCDELEQIFELGDAHQLNTLYSSQQICFPRISTIKVKKCNKLKCLFHNLSACHFTILRYLEIEECSQLHKVFAFSEEEMGRHEKQVVLQNLRETKLINLPHLEEIHHGFKLEDVEQTIKECPMYSPSLYLQPDM